MTGRVEFDKAVKQAILRRAMRDNRLHCEECGCDLTGKAVEIDHIIPEAIVRPVNPTKRLTPDDGMLLGRDCCHRSPDGKTARDMEAIARAKRREADHFGIRSKLSSRGFRKAPPQRTASRPISRQESR